MVWQAQLVECNFILKRVRQSGVALDFDCLQCTLSGFSRLSETSALCESSRQSTQVIGIFAARKSHGLFSELRRSAPITNGSVRGGREKPGQIVANQRVVSGDPRSVLVLGDPFFVQSVS